MDIKNVKIEASWQEALKEYLSTPEFGLLAKRIRSEYLNSAKTIYPDPKNIFRAFDETPFQDVKVVILGQDPYHNPGQAHGLAFSVPEGVQAPPSLINIFKEIQDSTGGTNKSTDLSRWARQGVLLLNSILTVVHSTPTSHSNIGWEDFTDNVLKTLSEKREHIVFMLWGAYARGKAGLIDKEKHLVLEAPHPSPLSAHRGFFGCGHFKKANEYLQKYNKKPIGW